MMRQPDEIQDASALPTYLTALWIETVRERVEWKIFINDDISMIHDVFRFHRFTQLKTDCHFIG